MICYTLKCQDNTQTQPAHPAERQVINMSSSENMKVTKTGNKLIIEMDLEPEASAPLSKSGESRLAFTTSGFKNEQGLGISINIIYK